LKVGADIHGAVVRQFSVGISRCYI